MKYRTLVLGLLLIPGVVVAEDINSIFKRVNDLTASGNFSKALEELDWAKREIEKQHTQKIQAFFPAALGEFKGEKFESNLAMGMLSVERSYEAGEGSVTASLTGGSGSGGAAGLGNLAQIGKMAAMMQNDSGQETIRIAGKTATVEKGEEGSSSSISVFLDSGAILKVDSSNAKVEDLKKWVELFKIAELDAYLKG
jgi:hypothetical protein